MSKFDFDDWEHGGDMCAFLYWDEKTGNVRAWRWEKGKRVEIGVLMFMENRDENGHLQQA